MYKKFAAFSKKEENKELVTHSMLALIARVGGSGIAFLMNVVIARYLGEKGSRFFFSCSYCFCYFGPLAGRLINQF